MAPGDGGLSHPDSLRFGVALADNPSVRGDWVFLVAGVLTLVLVGLLLMRPIPGAPKPTQFQSVAVDCSTGQGWIGDDGNTYCP